MKNRLPFPSIINILFVTVLFTIIAGCGAKSAIGGIAKEAESEVQEELTVVEDTASEAASVVASDESVEEISIEEKTSSDFISLPPEMENTDSPLPRYEYPGPEAFYTVLYAYLRDEFGSHYSDYDVCIPCPYILEIDDSDKDDIKVYGDFWIYNYNLDGDTLLFTSGGSYAGLIHMKFSDADYEVTGMDMVGDGSDFEPTARKIFGDRYDDYMLIASDKDMREGTRAQIVANYVAANDLNITQYQDYGWDPVPLPAENIDSFYSELN